MPTPCPVIGQVPGLRSPKYLPCSPVRWRQRTEADRCQQGLLHDAEHVVPPPGIEDGMTKGHRQDLVRSQGAVVPARPVHHVVEISAGLVPEALLERLFGAAGMLGEGLAISGPSAASAHPSRSFNALYQSALISTALPRRGVTTQSPTLASIM